MQKFTTAFCRVGGFASMVIAIGHASCKVRVDQQNVVALSPSW